MTAPLCRRPCKTCLCADNRATWLEAEIERLREEVRAKQRIIERMMESIPTRQP